MDGIVLIILPTQELNSLQLLYHFYVMVKINYKFLSFRLMELHVILLIVQIILIS